MPVKAVVQTLDDVPPEQHALYTQVGEIFVLQIEDVDSHPNVKNLKTAHEAVKATRLKLSNDLAAANAKLAALPENFDAEEYTRLKAEDDARKANPDNGDINKKIEQATAALNAQHNAVRAADKRTAEAALKAERDKTAALNAEIRRLLVDDTLTKGLVEVGIDPKFLKAAKALHSSNIEVIEAEGQHVPKMKAELGGEDVVKYIATWAQSDEGKAFVTPPKGGDANGADRSRRDTGINPFAKSGWNKTEQGQMLKADRGKAERLAKSAGFRDLDAALGAMSPKAPVAAQ